jgi:hypothetical protein
MTAPALSMDAEGGVVEVALGAGEGVLVGVDAGVVTGAGTVAGEVMVAMGDGDGVVVAGADVGPAASGVAPAVAVACGVAWAQPATADKVHRQKTATAL